jgi:hypothetical protein
MPGPPTTACRAASTDLARFASSRTRKAPVKRAIAPATGVLRHIHSFSNREPVAGGAAVLGLSVPRVGQTVRSLSLNRHCAPRCDQRVNQLLCIGASRLCPLSKFAPTA